MRNVITIMAVAGMTLVGASCNTAAVRQQEAAMKAQQATIDSMKIEMAKQQVIDSMNEVAKMNVVLPENMAPATQEASAPVRHTVAKKRKTTRSRSVASTSHSTRPREVSNSNNYPVAQSQTQTQPVYQEPAPVVTPAPEEKKKGWSAKAKGAVIGTGVGAAAGAIIGGKGNRAKGAIIGGIIGAAGGLGTGAVIDKKNGR